ncbi:FAD-dependent oxidoreductase [Kineosporia sp. NBRC 101731]|uniref:NAD(P)/FAD-dependent oxidoreductase n=1 Tax=Kineosporia sp. NBRC 101731 TaxID=3032199 RepID=UPI0024A1FDF6|nr:FAD-dependent oxidoreductase [Kineosporia sp. NBRC 101731]GLY28363.1 hypothetical protein Kisp02_17280 [Kineosporia sp. NBRC 101731]
MDAVDVAIVGGGVIGALIAHEVVAASPGTTVVVLEQGLIGQGASSRSAGVHFPRGATERVRSMAEYSQGVWERLAAELDLPIRQVDATVVTGGDAGAVSTTYVRLGDEIAWSGAARDGGPGVAARAWKVEGCHYADVQGVANRLLAGLRDRVTVLEGAEVGEICDGPDGRIRLTLGHGRQVLARQVVLAPGPWIAHPAWADLLAPLELRVKRVVAAHLALLPSPDDPLTIFHDHDAFLLPLLERNHFLFSYTSDRWDVDPDDVGRGLESFDLDDARAALARFAPGLVARCDSGRVFCDAYSPNREPVVAQLRPGLVFAGAANGSGYRLAPAIAVETVAALDLAPHLVPHRNSYQQPQRLA